MDPELGVFRDAQLVDRVGGGEPDDSGTELCATLPVLNLRLLVGVDSPLGIGIQCLASE